MNRTEELRQQMIQQLEADIDDYKKYGDDQYGPNMVAVDIVTARRTVELLKKLDVPIEAEWHYYMNEEGKARWRCTNCGRVCKRNPYDKQRCSTCGAHTRLES